MGVKENEGVRDNQGSHQDGKKKVLSEVRLAIQCKHVFKPGD